VDDMCYDRRRAEACVDESAHAQIFSRFSNFESDVRRNIGNKT